MVKTEKRDTPLLFKRFLSRPLRIACVFPSSTRLVERVASKLSLETPKIIVEFGPGEGCHTRRIVSEMHPNSRYLMFELDPVLASKLDSDFEHDPRIEVINRDATFFAEELERRGLEQCDYIITGIPFSLLPVNKRQRLLEAMHAMLAPDGALVYYQVTNELMKQAAGFRLVDTEYCLGNLPPLFVTVLAKQPTRAKNQSL